MKENLMATAGRLMGEEMAMNEDFDLWGFGMDEATARETFPYGVENYDRIAKRREEARLKEEAIKNRTTVIAGDLKSLRQRLLDLAELDDTVDAHELADKALIDFIGNRRVKNLFDAIDKWYS